MCEYNLNLYDENWNLTEEALEDLRPIVYILEDIMKEYGVSRKMALQAIEDYVFRL